MRPIIPPPLITLCLAGAMYGVAQRWTLAPFDFSGRAIAGASIMIVGFAIIAVSAGAFRKAGTTVNPLAPEKAETLVVKDLFKVTRNPMYVGMLTMLAGAAVLSAEGANALFLPLFVALLTELQIKPEEKALEAKFGDAYRDYKKRVRRWL